mgnify:CR=1 FL=1
MGLFGVPYDGTTSFRPGTRFGPRQIRAESCMIRPYNMATRAKPFESFQVADIGDVAINTFDLKKTVGIIETAYDAILAENCTPLTLGGDHTLTLPILRANAPQTLPSHRNGEAVSSPRRCCWSCSARSSIAARLACSFLVTSSTLMPWPSSMMERGTDW